jgi:hypothetical protein
LGAPANTSYASAISENEILYLDDLSQQFDNMTPVFIATSHGTAVSTANPYRYDMTINGVKQKFNSIDYVWQSDLAKPEFTIDNDGNLKFLTVPAIGDVFDGRIMAGASSSLRITNYPFAAADVLLGA